jgi:hypothetical protein
MRPTNAFFDRYTLIPPIGMVKSIDASMRSVFVINDNYLLIFEKQQFVLEKTLHFEKDVRLVGYDRYFDDVWVLTQNSLIRLNALTFSAQEYTLSTAVAAFGIGPDALYLDGVTDYRLDKRTGMLARISQFPGNLTWRRSTTNSELRQYPFLTPYYYYDTPEETQQPFSEFSITALHADGIDLYVGTDRYGILKYNTVSWNKERFVYGPLDSRIYRVRQFEDAIYFISARGISIYPHNTQNWQYQRFAQRVTDILPLGNTFLFSVGNRLSELDSGVMLTVGNTTADILALSADESHVYVGTRSGLFRMEKSGGTLTSFGPDRYAVYSVYTTDDMIYVGDEFALYAYDRPARTWAEIVPLGIKDIVELNGDLFLLGLNNQLMRYPLHEDTTSQDSADWFFLPYFNIYDIDTDHDVLYCASFAGIYTYEPETEFYTMIHDLPSLQYDYVFVIDSTIVAVSQDNLYALPVEDAE